MSAPPYVPIFTDDYIGDTIDLSIEEHGAYFLLILACWKQDDCSLPDDDRKLARICRVSTRKWKQIRATMEAYWTVEDGRWTHERLTKERVYVENRSNSARENARKRWDAQPTENKQTEKCDSICNGNAAADAAGDALQPQPHIEEPNGSSPPKAPQHHRGRDWPQIPDWVPVEPWNAFIDMRKRKRANPTPRAVELLLGNLTKLRAKGHDPGRVLDQSTLKNWTDIYPLKEDHHGNSGTGSWNRDRRDGAARAADRYIFGDGERPAGSTG